MATRATSKGDPAPRVISLRLKKGEAERLTRLARLFRRSVSSTASLLLEEKLREDAFPHIQFRDSSLGRQAFIRGRRLSVWEVSWLSRQIQKNPTGLANHLGWPAEVVESALAYAEAFPEEIEPLVAEAESVTLEELKRRIPGLQTIKV